MWSRSVIRRFQSRISMISSFQSLTSNFSSSSSFSSDHVHLIKDQFSKQAIPFAEFYIHSDKENLDMIRKELQLQGKEVIVDVGCGPGIVACHLAPFAKQVIGIDITPAMLAKATNVAKQNGLTNLKFMEGLMEKLPLDDHTVDGVVTRFTFHHLVRPELAIAEMVRICKPGGRIVICDATPRKECRQNYDTFEKLRDPSHTSAMTTEELQNLSKKWLVDTKIQASRLSSKVKDLLDRAFPTDGQNGIERLRKIFEDDMEKDTLDMGVKYVNKDLYMSFPISIVSGSTKKLYE